MTVEHLPRNTTVPIPIDVSLFSGTTPQTGQAGSLTLRIIALENGYTLDHADGLFRLSAATPTQTLTAFTDYTHDYSKVVPQTTNWPRGHYRGLVRHSDGREWQFDFTVGLFVPRQLGYSVVYDGATLNLSVWIEEHGVVQTDYTAINNCKIMDCLGATLSDGTLGNKSTQTNGVFNWQVTVALAPVTNYVFECDATVAGPAGQSAFVFKLRVGLARP